LETFLILHAAHGQNASTSTGEFIRTRTHTHTYTYVCIHTYIHIYTYTTVRIAGSSKANPFACIASGIGMYTRTLIYA